MPEPLILKVQADTKGVPEGFNRITKSTDDLDLSSRKASATVKAFVADLAEAKTGADVASAALGAFGKILGTSIAGTAIAIAGKAVIDTFAKIGEAVDQSRERIESAVADIKKSGLDVSFSQASAEAKKLSDEAENARKNIQKLDKSFLSGIIATITGAREELGKLANEADRLSQQRLFEGAKAERERAEERRGLTESQLGIKDVQERLKQELKAVDITTPEGLKAANELRKKAELDVADIRKKALDKFDAEQAKKRLDEIEAEIRGKTDAEKIARASQARADEDSKKRIAQLEEERAKKQEELAKYKLKLEKDASDLKIDQLNLEERLIEQRRRITSAEGKVASEVARQGGTGRGPGQKPTAFEIGATKRAEKAAQDEAYRLRNIEMERVRGELQTREMERRSRAGELPGETPRISNYEVQKEIARKMKDSAKAEKNDIYNDAKNARDGAQATEKTLKDVKENLKKVLEELKSYAHAS